MDKLKIGYLDQSFEIAVDKFKILLGKNFHTKFEILKSIIQYFEKKSYSEYQKQNNVNCLVEMNERRLDVKQWDLISINHYFDLNQDIKLGSKSLLLKYFETMLRDLEYNDIVNTINILLGDLNENIIKDKIYKENSNINLNANIQNLNLKSIIKLLEVNIEKDMVEAHGYDLNYDEIICFQLDLIEQIVTQNVEKRFFVIVDIPALSLKIFQKLQEVIGAITIINTDKINKEVQFDINDVCYINKQITDMSMDDKIYYDIIMELPFNLTIDEFKIEFTNMINNNYNDKSRYLNKLL